jgi:hypothetical protein
VYTLFGPSSHTPHSTLLFPDYVEKQIKDYKKIMAFLLDRDEDSHTERSLACFHARVHYNQTGSSLPDLFTTS